MAVYLTKGEAVFFQIGNGCPGDKGFDARQ